jgi:methionyl-tRNA formyltransferase
MRIVFMGTPAFALPSLEALLSYRCDVVAVVTGPDKPKGRGQLVAPSSVKEHSLKRNIPVLQPERLSDSDFLQHLTSLRPDLFSVVAFRILPRSVLSIPRLGSFNLHASLLPKYRGAAPINRAIMNGETETGVTTFFLEEAVDTGSVILQARVRIGENETAGELADRLAQVGSEVVVQTVRLIETGNVRTQPQDSSLSSLAPKIFKEDCRIDWNRSAVEVHNHVRGLSPLPGAWTTLGEKVLKVYRTELVRHSGEATLPGMLPPGAVARIDPAGLLVRSGDRLISLLEVQLEGKRRMGIAEFLRGFRIDVGHVFV